MAFVSFDVGLVDFWCCNNVSGEGRKVQRSVGFESPTKRAALVGQREALGVGVQPGTPTGFAAIEIQNDSSCLCDDPHEVGLGSPTPAAHTGADWS